MHRTFVLSLFTTVLNLWAISSVAKANNNEEKKPVPAPQPELSSVNAVAPQNQSDHIEAARTFFDQGTALYEAGKYNLAADAFRSANQLNPNWKLHFNIGQCEALAKRHGLSLQAFEAYLSKGGDDIPLTRQAEVRSEIARLREMTGSIEIIAPDGAAIIIDGVERGISPLSGHIPVAAGMTHLVRIEAEAVASQSQKVIVTGGKTVELNFLQKDSYPGGPATVSSIDIPVDRDQPVAPPNKSSTATQNISTLRRWAITSFVAAGTVLLAGSITGLASARKFERLEGACSDNICTNKADQTTIVDIDTLTLTTDILLATGGVLAVTGIVLLVIERKRHKPDHAGINIHASATSIWVGGRF